MAKHLGVGIIGVGMLGRRHAENLAHRIGCTRLVAVADAVPETARAVAEALDVPRWYTTAAELAADPDVEAVVIASADPAHGEGIIAAATHKKDVFCEKPITTTLEEADRALAAVAEAGVRLQIGFMRRYDPAYVAAKRHIDEGRIGTPILFKAIHRNRTSGPMSATAKAATAPNDQAFVNSAIHDYNDARWLLGDEVAEVQAVMARQSDPDPGAEPVDLALSTLRFVRGGLGHVEGISAAHYAYDVRTEIVGTKGALFIGRPRGTDCVLATEDGLASDAVGHWLDRYGETYLIELDDWARRTLAGEPPAVTGADGRAALEIAIAATRSYHEGRTISLPLA
ncbi:MAG: Gfo/Idh/MocA family oxidoreductase [Thermomicrobiales bacterium]